MVIGLMMSTGYIVSGILLTLLLGALIATAVWIVNRMPPEYVLHILVPEDESDLERFTTILERHASRVRLEKVRTTNMGSMFELVYTLIPQGSIAALLDEVRSNNHNLNVSLHTAKTDNVL